MRTEWLKSNGVCRRWYACVRAPVKSDVVVPCGLFAWCSDGVRSLEGVWCECMRVRLLGACEELKDCSCQEDAKPKRREKRGLEDWRLWMVADLE